MTSPGTDIIIQHTTVTEITNPAAEVEVITVQVPGISGPQGPQGTPGPPNVLTIGTVSNSAPGDPADASITGSAPNQTLNLVLPQGTQGPQGDVGPPPTLSIGTVTTGAAGTSASASLDSSAAPAYVLSFTIPQGANGGGVVAGGATGDVLMKNSATDFDTKWSTPTSAATASALMERDASGRAQVVDPSASADISTKNYTDTQDASNRRPLTDNQTANYTLVLTDERKLVQMNATTTTTLTIPPNSSVAFPLGTVIDVQMLNTGSVTIAGGAGVTIRSPGGLLSITKQYSVVRLTKFLTDTWVLQNIGPASSTSTSTASTVMQRDAGGRASVADPSASTDIATKNYVDSTAGTSAATASALVRRDANGRAQVADPSATADIATKNYVDNTAGTSVSTASALMRRDASGRASVADPSASTDISTKNYTDTQDASMRRPQLNTQTVSYTLVLTDERKLVQMNSASATTLTVPLNSSVAFPVGTVVEVQMLGTGNVTIAPTAGVTLNSTLPSLVITRQYAVVLLQKTGTDTWNVDRISNASATSASTASTIILRDTAGRASVADPSASTDIATKNYADTQDLAMRRESVNTQTASYTIVLTDERKLLQMNSASTTTVTIPTNATTAFPIGTVIDVQQAGAGAVNFTPSGTVTLNGVNGTLSMTRQNTNVRLQKYGTDAWSIVNLSQANATSANTANLLVLRDGSARAQFADPSAAQDAATKNYVDTKAIYPSSVTLTDAATIATDASLGRLFRVTVTASRTMGVPSNPTDGQRIMYEVTASGGSWTLTMSSSAGGFKFGTDFTSIPTISTGTTTYIGAMYSSRDSFWHVLAVGSGH